MAVTVNGGSATYLNLAGATVGSGTPVALAYTAPAGTSCLVVIPLINCAAPAVETAVSYNSVAATLVASSFISNNAGDQVSIWYLKNPTTGSSVNLSVTWAQAVAGGGGVIVVPLIGTDPTTPVGTPGTGFSNTLVTSGTITVPGATAHDLNVAGILVDGGGGVPTAADGQTNLINTTSRGSVRILGSDAAGTTTSMSWNSFSIANAWAASGVAFLAPSAVTLDAGYLPRPGPGISPFALNQFKVPIRDTRSVSNQLSGISLGVSSVFGSQIASGSLSGLSNSASVLYGQSTGGGALGGNTYGVSIEFAVLGQSGVLIGNIPKGGPGISPSSLFQFSSLILDDTINLALIQGQIIGNSTLAFGQLIGTGGLGGISTSISTLYHVSIGGVLAGFTSSSSTVYAGIGGSILTNGRSYSVSLSYAGIQGLTLSSISGESYSTSITYGVATGLLLSQLVGSSYSVSIDYGTIISSLQPAGTALMPNVIGVILQQALQILQDAGVLVPSKIGYFGTYPVSVRFIPSTSINEQNATYIGDFGVVHAQSVAPGIPVVPNSPLVLVCSDFPANVAFP